MPTAKKPTAKKPAAKKTTVKKAAPAPVRVPNTFKAGLLIIGLGVCLLGGFGLYFLLKK